MLISGGKGGSGPGDQSPGVEGEGPGRGGALLIRTSESAMLCGPVFSRLCLGAERTLFCSWKQKQNGGCQGLQGGGAWERLVKGRQPPVIRRVSSEALTYSVVAVVNNTLLYS